LSIIAIIRMNRAMNPTSPNAIKIKWMLISFASLKEERGRGGKKKEGFEMKG
jgi:hypothetical protein